MAKGLRSSVKKANRSKLRSTVFKQVEDARAERINAKLLEIVQQAKPEHQPKQADMDVDSAQESTPAAPDAANEYPKEMDVDGTAPTSLSKSKSKGKINKSKLKKRTKPRNQISFPATRGKGALKPFSESRVRKRR